MPIDDVSDLPFDPVRVRLKLHALRKQADGLTALLESYGLPVEAPRDPYRPLLSADHAKPKATANEATRAERKSSKPRFADFAVDGTLRAGGGAQGKVIVDALVKAGHMNGVAHPDSNISTALSRDARVRRVEGVRNTWELVGV